MDFREFDLLPGTWVNKAKKKGRGPVGTPTCCNSLQPLVAGMRDLAHRTRVTPAQEVELAILAHL
jgi:hypothetical protein